MKITRISATHFKGLTFDEDLSPLTMFVGSNFRGKSARTDAIRLALLGYLPELGATNKATFSLASGAVMSVEATFDNGLSIFRKWSLKGNSVTCEEDIPDEIKNAGQLAVMLNSDEYFSLSDQKRVEYVFGLVDIAGVWTANGIATRIAEKVPDAVTPPVEGKKSIIAEILGFNVGVVPVQQFVSDSLVKVAELWKIAAADVKRKEATIVTLTQARAADTFSGPSMSSLDAMRKRLTGEIALLNEEIGGKRSTFAAMVTARQRREAIDRELRFGDKNRTQLATLKDTQASVKQSLESFPVHEYSTVRSLNAEITGLKRQYDRNVSTADEHKRARLTAEQLLASLDKQTVCPYCGATGTGWKVLKSSELKQTIDAEELARVKAVAAAETLTPQIEALEKKVKEIELDIERRKLVDDKLQLLTAQISALEPQLARLEAMTEERARLAPEDAQLDASVQAIQTSLNVKNDELRSVESSIKALQGREHEKKRMADAEAERDAAKKEADTAKAVGVELKVIQGEMIHSAFGPIIAFANELFGGILKTPLAYNQDGGEIGRWDGPSWIGHHTFSGSEKCLCYAAIQAALSHQSPVKLMVIDELGRFAPDTLAILLASVTQAIESRQIDQFVGCVAGAFPLPEDSSFQITEIK